MPTDQYPPIQSACYCFSTWERTRRTLYPQASVCPGSFPHLLRLDGQPIEMSQCPSEKHCVLSNASLHRDKPGSKALKDMQCGTQEETPRRDSEVLGRMIVDKFIALPALPHLLQQEIMLGGLSQH